MILPILDYAPSETNTLQDTVYAKSGGGTEDFTVQQSSIYPKMIPVLKDEQVFTPQVLPMENSEVTSIKPISPVDEGTVLTKYPFTVEDDIDFTDTPKTSLPIDKTAIIDNVRNIVDSLQDKRDAANTTMYIIIGIAVLLLIALFYYLSNKKK